MNCSQSTETGATSSEAIPKHQPESCHFERGDLVLLRALQRLEMNESAGTLCHLQENNRWEVLLDGSRKISVHTSHLIPKPVDVHDTVRIHSLMRTELNGFVGTVEKRNNGRWHVVLRNPDRTVAIQSKNLAAVSSDCKPPPIGGHVKTNDTVEYESEEGSDSIPNVKCVAESDAEAFPVLAATPADESRTDSQPSTGIDTALGDVFSTRGVSNGHDGPVATAVSGAL